jgi:tetratricopeptide (TPR) repeat protein
MGAERLKVAYEFEKDAKSGSRITLSRKNYANQEILNIDFPAIGGSAIATETRDNQTYFYSESNLLPSKQINREPPKRIGVVWDASGSGAERDHEKEFELLDGYFKVLKNVQVQLILARDKAQPTQEFTVVNGDWQALRKALENVAYDGATSQAALSPPSATQLNLLFSDGLVNYGNGELLAGSAALFSVNAATSSDLPRLRSWAERNGGRLLNLQNIATAHALQELTHQSPQLLGIIGHGAKELLSASGYAEAKRVRIAGILTAPDASIELDWDLGEGQHYKPIIQIKNAVATTLAASRWANLKLAQLELDYSANRAAIGRIGKQFAMVTRETSLIVLDRVEDYVRYEIAPPESLRGEYESQLAKKNRDTSLQRSLHIDEVAKKFEQKTAWWEKTFPKGDKPVPPAPESKSDTESDQAPPRSLMAMAAAPVQSARAVSAAMPMARVAAAPQTPVELSIQLKKWQPESPYVSRLRAAVPEQLYAIYLDERPAYVNSTAFFLDVADIFIERGQVELGLRILSNLAEMNLENRQILRILAYRLLQAKQTQLALPILRQVLVLSPNEPQSWRDLGLAYAEDGQYQLAVDNLWEVVAHPWHDRFPDIELIALAELNAIIARAPKDSVIDTSRMDARLLHNLPLDVRAVLSWDADNTDIDLWVTDPNDEKVYYANRLGYQGGSMSRDFTSGYGPEEFSLRDAKPGKYKLQAQFYGNRQQVVAGATTLMLRLSTGFGTAQQQDQKIILRLSGQGALVDVGAFEVAR